MSFFKSKIIRNLNSLLGKLLLIFVLSGLRLMNESTHQYWEY